MYIYTHTHTCTHETLVIFSTNIIMHIFQVMNTRFFSYLVFHEHVLVTIIALFNKYTQSSASYGRFFDFNIRGYFL